MAFKTAEAKKEEVEALRNSAESIKQQIAEHERWLSYQKPLSECVGGRPFGSQTLSWIQDQRNKYAMADILVKHFTKLEEDMLESIAAVRAEVERLKGRILYSGAK